MLLAAILVLEVSLADTVSVRAVQHAPAVHRLSDSAGWGSPQIRIRTGQGSASVWLLAVADSVYVVALLRDTTAHWSDEFVVSLDTEGDRAAAPQQGPSPLCRFAALPALSTPALRPASPALRPTAGHGAQGQRRVHRPALPHPSPAGSPSWQ